MLSAYSSFLTTEQKAQASSIEMLDEVEEWEMIMSHYALIVGSNAEQNTSFTSLLNPST